MSEVASEVAIPFIKKLEQAHFGHLWLKNDLLTVKSLSDQLFLINSLKNWL